MSASAQPSASLSRKERARAAEQAIWAALLAARTVGDRPAYLAARSAIVGLHVQTVEIVVAKMLGRLSTQADPDAVRSDAFLGLLDAIERFEPSRGLWFGTFASSRIRGAILDGLRERMGSTRLGNDRARRLDAWLSRVEQAKGGRVGLHEAADVAGVAAEDLHRWADHVRDTCRLGEESVLSFQGKIFDDGKSLGEVLPSRAGDPAQELAALDEAERLLEMLPAGKLHDHTLNPRHQPGRGAGRPSQWAVPPLQSIVRWYLLDGLTMNEIGRRLRISESRVSQFYAQAIAMLRARHEPATKPPATPDATGPPAGQ